MRWTPSQNLRSVIRSVPQPTQGVPDVVKNSLNYKNCNSFTANYKARKTSSLRIFENCVHCGILKFGSSLPLAAPGAEVCGRPEAGIEFRTKLVATRTKRSLTAGGYGGYSRQMEFIKALPFVAPLREHPERRLVIAKRPEGLYTIIEEYNYRSADEDGSVYVGGWAPLPADGIFEDEATAVREAERIISTSS